MEILEFKRAFSGRLVRVRDLQSQATTFKIWAFIAACFLQCGAAMPQTTGNSSNSDVPSTTKSNNKSNSKQKSAIETPVAPPVVPIKASPASPLTKDGIEKVELDTEAYDFESLGFKFYFFQDSLGRCGLVRSRRCLASLF